MFNNAKEHVIFKDLRVIPIIQNINSHFFKSSESINFSGNKVLLKTSANDCPLNYTAVLLGTPFTIILRIILPLLY